MAEDRPPNTPPKPSPSPDESIEFLRVELPADEIAERDAFVEGRLQADATGPRAQLSPRPPPPVKSPPRGTFVGLAVALGLVSLGVGYFLLR